MIMSSLESHLLSFEEMLVLDLRLLRDEGKRGGKTRKTRQKAECLHICSGCENSEVVRAACE